MNFIDINHHIKGNPNLRAEYAHNFRLNADFVKVFKDEKLLKLQASVFANTIKDRIALFSYELDSTGQYQMDTTGTSFKYAYFNIDNYKNWGSNLKLKYQHKGLTVQLGTLLIGHYNALNESFEKEVNPFSYTLEFTQEITYQFEKANLYLTLMRKDFDKRLSYSAYSSPMTGDPVIVTNETAGFALMDFTATKKWFNGGIHLTCGVKNILNIRQVAQSGQAMSAHGGGGASMTVGMGRIGFVRILCNPFAIVRDHKKLKERIAF